VVPAQSPIASAIARLNLHVRHIGRIRWQAYNGAETRVTRRVTLPEGFEKPKPRSAGSLDTAACCGLQPFLYNALIQLRLTDVTPDLSQHLSSIVGSRQQCVHSVHGILADPALGR